MGTVHAAVIALGAIVLVGALIGFVRLFRLPADPGSGNRGYGVIPGEGSGDSSDGFHSGVDSGPS
jgi:hypothetical protein